MTDLEEVLARLGLSQYLGRLCEEGFEKWEAVMDITEQDLAFLNFKLGHRRVLQREIASARGVPPSQALIPIQNYPAEDNEPEDRSSPKPFKQDSGRGMPPTGKRKYRRHPKPDEHAPEKPPSAYVMFANRVRDELKGQNLSFTDIAKLVGEKWKILDPENKESYELEASIAKEKYNSELQEYKKTESYREYVQYLSEFKSKASKEGREGSEQAEANRKRPKLESLPAISTPVSATTISNLSGLTGGLSATSSTVVGSGRGGGPTASGTATSSEQSAYTSPSTHDSGAPHALGSQSVTPSAPRSYPISRSRSPSDVARYKDAVVRTTQQQHEGFVTPVTDPEPFFPRIHPTIQGPHIQQQPSFLRHQPPPMGAQPISRSGPPIPNPAIRRASLRSDDALPPTPASMGSASPPAPSISSSVSSFDDGGRPHRSLHSLPPPTPGPGAGSGYFDQRPPHRRSPRTPYLPPPSSTGILPHQKYHGYQSSTSPLTSSTLASAPSQSPLTSSPENLPLPSSGVNPSPPKPKPPS